MNGYGRGVRAILAVLLLGSAAPAFAETAPREKPAVVEEQGVAIEVPDPTPTGLLIAWKPALLSVRVDSGSGSRFGSDSLQPLRGVARLVTELLDRLDLTDVTLAGNDTGGALVQLIMADGPARVGRVVLASCDAFDNFPPGLTGKTLVLAGKLPPALFGLFMQQLRLRPVRRLPIAFGWLTRRGDAATARWLTPVLTRRDIRRDTVRVLRAAAAERGIMLDVARRLPGFDRPALVVWASADRVMPPGHGRRLAGILPQGRLVEVADSYTLIPLDQPAWLARTIREFTYAPRTAVPPTPAT